MLCCMLRWIFVGTAMSLPYKFQTAEEKEEASVFELQTQVFSVSRTTDSEMIQW